MFDLGGEIVSDAHEEEFEAALLDLSSGIAQKIDNYAFLIKDLQNTAERLGEFIDKAKSRLKQINTLEENLKTRAKIAMREMNVTELQGEYNKFKMSSLSPSVEIISEDALPMKFIREKLVMEPDKKAIKEALLAGEYVQGAQLKETNTLRISYSPKMKEVK